MRGHDKHPGYDELIMTWEQWLTYRLEPQQMIINASAVDGSDFHQAHPIGFSVFFCPALPSNPQEFTPTAGSRAAGVWANAIFSEDTTPYRKRLITQLRDVNADFQLMIDVVKQKQRKPPEHVRDWYAKTPFTISPRGAGFDCHRTYEALIHKSIPVVLGFDDSLQDKYSDLPVLFVDDPRDLTSEYFETVYPRMCKTRFNFNQLTRDYWAKRRPDVSIGYQSVFWLHQFGQLSHMMQYLWPSDLELIDNIPKKRYYTH